MIGALIGDLAAWTYVHEPDTFWRQLIPDNGKGAVPSVYGHTLMKAASHNILECPWIDPAPLGTPEDGPGYYGQWLMWHIVGAWTDNCLLRDLPDFHSYDKEEGYARLFIMDLISKLRNGATKSEAYHTTDKFESLSKHWKWRKVSPELGLLTYVFRAWNAFYLGHDFTSVIHNAAQWPDDKHLTCAIAGAFADAMYGCEYNMIKQKYAKDGETEKFFGLLFTGEEYGYHNALIEEMAAVSNSKRSFFPKNNALTNAERHTWTEIFNPWHNYLITPEVKACIFKSFYPDWEHRHSFYYDDGWVYCCRSHVLLCRFQLVKQEDDSFRIRHLQKSEDKHRYHFALEDALSNVRVSCKDHHFSPALDYCRYYEGELEMPKCYKTDKVKGNFWYGEMMFCTTGCNLQEWIVQGESIKKNLTGKPRECADLLHKEQLALAVYIETLFEKWSPYEDCNWIFEY